MNAAVTTFCLRTLVSSLAWTAPLMLSLGITRCAESPSSPLSAGDQVSEALVSSTFAQLLAAVKADPKLVDRVVSAQEQTIESSVPANAGDAVSHAATEVAAQLASSYHSLGALITAQQVNPRAVTLTEVRTALLAMQLHQPGDLGAFAGESYQNRLKVLASSLKVALFLQQLQTNSEGLALDTMTSWPPTDPSVASQTGAPMGSYQPPNAHVWLVAYQTDPAQTTDPKVTSGPMQPGKAPNGGDFGSKSAHAQDQCNYYKLQLQRTDVNLVTRYYCEIGPTAPWDKPAPTSNAPQNTQGGQPSNDSANAVPFKPDENYGG